MKEAMKQTNEMMKREATEGGLSLNVNKTKIMVQSRGDTHWKGNEDKKRHD
jgi:hypothetical protein